MPPPPPPPGPSFPAQPPGYQPYGAAPQPAGNSGMSIASLVLSLVGLIPCFWGLQLPGLLGVIFGFIGLKQTKNGARKGRGMAIAGVVIGIILLLIFAALWAYILTSDDCTFEGGQLECIVD